MPTDALLRYRAAARKRPCAGRSPRAGRRLTETTADGDRRGTRRRCSLRGSREPGLVAVYLSVGTEPDTATLIERCGCARCR